tara:strand:+ start:1493 stop:1867 length:375 start_codon:yes stop_codon:yes gene_type:complete
MYYIRLSGENNDVLTYYCRNCGNENSSLTVKDSLCVSKSLINGKANSYKHFVNEYTKLDPTLPRINKLTCPNKECITNKNKNTEEGEETSSNVKNEIIYLRYNDTDMKYIYLCCNCDHVWKIDN